VVSAALASGRKVGENATRVWTHAHWRLQFSDLPPLRAEPRLRGMRVRKHCAVPALKESHRGLSVSSHRAPRGLLVGCRDPLIRPACGPPYRCVAGQAGSKVGWNPCHRMVIHGGPVLGVGMKATGRLAFQHGAGRATADRAISRARLVGPQEAKTPLGSRAGNLLRTVAVLGTGLRGPKGHRRANPLPNGLAARRGWRGDGTIAKLARAV